MSAHAAIRAGRDLLGPDLTSLPTLAQQLSTLDAAKAGGADDYALAWLEISDANGGGATLLWRGDEPEDHPGDIMTGVVMDEQEAERFLRRDALNSHSSGVPGFAEKLQAELIRRGRYTDNRKTDPDHVAEVMAEFLATGGALMVNPQGKLELGGDAARMYSSRVGAEAGERARSAGKALIVLLRRWRARDLVTAVVRDEGTMLENGWTVLEASA